jgi:hypothetical protein
MKCRRASDREHSFVPAECEVANARASDAPDPGIVKLPIFVASPEKQRDAGKHTWAPLSGKVFCAAAL